MTQQSPSHNLINLPPLGLRDLIVMQSKPNGTPLKTYNIQLSLAIPLWMNDLIHMPPPLQLWNLLRTYSDQPLLSKYEHNLTVHHNVPYLQHLNKNNFRSHLNCSILVMVCLHQQS